MILASTDCNAVSLGVAKDTGVKEVRDLRGKRIGMVVGSPALNAFNQDWSYGFGNWLECPTAMGANTFDCGSGHRNSSPGAYGAYPFIDFDTTLIMDGLPLTSS